LKNELVKSGIEKIWIQLCWQGARLGVTGKIGLGLIVIAAIFLMGTVLPQDRTLKALKLRAETMKSQPGKVNAPHNYISIFYFLTNFLIQNREYLVLIGHVFSLAWLFC